MNDVFVSEVMNPATVKYFIGDLCYVLNDEWGEVCSITLAPTVDPEEDFFFELADGRTFHMIGTAYGDGVYNDQFGNCYPVDSGTIGAIRVDALDPVVLAEALENRLGAVHEFPYELGAFDAELENGLITFDRVTIDTAGWEEEDDDEEEADAAYGED